ncbi:MAG: exodeoxyribonuclease VII small subunit [Clostridia bacterium]|nr:exodeoxyribonuclease VII small subunit [Clostridia bacterium]
MEKTYEESIKELETIINKLENGTETLEESMNLFEIGMQLVGECNSKLEKAEKKIVELTEKDGVVEETQLKIEGV